MKRFGSRKFIASTLTAGALIILPFLYKIFGLDQSLLSIVLPAITSLAAVYLGTNVIESVKGKDGSGG